MTTIKNHEYYIKRCIELAKKGKGYVSPNPLVGCVIVKKGKIISEGYHQKFGAPHAEVNAINSALEKGFELKGSTLYTNLEPCTHFGKTPPCVDMIIKQKIGKVIIGLEDPNPLVSGKGIKKLKRNGIKVETGILKKECSELNKFYLKNIKTGLPYITLKAAQTLDGKIAHEQNKEWISSPESRRMVHKLRSQYDAVLAGKNTVEKDDPQLNVRLVKGRHPWRIVIDKSLKLGINKKIFNDELTARTIILTSHNSLKKNSNEKMHFENKGVRLLFVKEKLDGNLDLKDGMKKLSKLGISSILVEGGAYTFSRFIKQNLVDEILIFIAPKIFGSGLNTFDSQSKIWNIKFRNISCENSGKDILIKLKL